MKLVLAFKTGSGTAFIGQSPDGRFHAIWKSQSLGSYRTAQHAIDDMAGGHTFTPSDGVDLGELGISDDVGDWVTPGNAQ